MKLQTGLQVKQTQTLAMTPQMQQAIRLLQFNNLELEQYLADEVQQNPLLERQSKNDFEETSRKTSLGEDSLAVDMKIAHKEISGIGTDADYENRWDSDRPPVSQSRLHQTQKMEMNRLPGESRKLADPGYVIEQTVSQADTLRGHLLMQLREENLRQPLKSICFALIEWLDSDGYLRETDKEIIEALGIDYAQLDEAFCFLRRLTPAGVFARDLADCLSLQLQAKNLWTPAYNVLVQNLPLIMQGELATLARKCDVSHTLLNRMIHELRPLDPHPGRAFENDILQTRPPEVIIREQGGTWHVELNEESLPKILLLDGYWEELAARKMSKQDRKYLNKCYQSGQWLVKALNQRAATILQVAREITRRQHAFLEKGVHHLQPMILRDIAEELDLHESTVSRVTANKLVQTPRGVFDMRYFFSAAINHNNNGTAHSAEAVRARIKELIVAETASKTLSDEALVKALQADGIDIARRTIAKYREAMHIPNSTQRKRLAKLAG